MSKDESFGSYLIFLGLLQGSLYAASAGEGDLVGVLFYFDPRILIYALEETLFGPHIAALAPVRWLTARWLIAMGIQIARGRLSIRAYVISELIMLLPSLFFIGVVVVASMSPAHGFSVGELLIPVTVMLLFSVLTLALALLPGRETPDSDKLPN